MNMDGTLNFDKYVIKRTNTVIVNMLDSYHFDEEILFT